MSTACPRRSIPRLRDEQGSATIEMLAGLPLLMAAVFFAVFCGRITLAHLDIAAAAAAAARTATLQRDPAAAIYTARRDADAALARRHLTCTRLNVAVDTSRFQPGGAVTVTLSCAVTTADLTGPGLPGAVTVTAASTQPIDTWRALASRP